jgi:putative oxidoreductase
MKKQILLETAVTLLVMMFLYASFSKYFDFSEFQRAMHKQPFPGWFNTVLTIIIPPAEILISILLMMEKTRKRGLWGAAILMTLFTLYISAVLLRVFPRVPCSCGGIIKRLNWQQHLVFNLFFLGLAITGLFHQHKMTRGHIGLKSTRS